MDLVPALGTERIKTRRGNEDAVIAEERGKGWSQIRRKQKAWTSFILLPLRIRVKKLLYAYFEEKISEEIVFAVNPIQGKILQRIYHFNHKLAQSF